jgi:hypothetical protein
MAPADPPDRLFAPSPPPSAGINRIRFAGRGNEPPLSRYALRVRLPGDQRIVAVSAPGGKGQRTRGGYI